MGVATLDQAYTVTQLSCPKCGSVPEPSSSPNELARCSSCGIIGRIDDPDGGQRRLVAEPAIDVKFAMESLRAEFDENDAPRLHRSEMLFAPYWHVRSVVIGSVEGVEQTTTNEIRREISIEGATVYNRVEKKGEPRPVQRDVQKIHHALISACPLEEVGIPTLDRHQQAPGAVSAARTLDGDAKLSCFNAEALRARGTLLDPVVSRPEAIEQAEELVEALIDGMSANLLPGATTSRALIDRDVLLVYHPVLLLTYQIRGQRLRATIDGVTGRVIDHQLPREDVRSMERRILGIAGLLAGVVVGALLRISLFAPGIMQGIPQSSRERAGVFALVLLLIGGLGLWQLQRVMEKSS